VKSNQEIISILIELFSLTHIMVSHPSLFFCLLVSEFCNVGVSYVIPVLKFVPFFLLLKIC
jgi:hypothetical protein